MEPPVASSGRTFRRASSFSHRQERALKDINGRVNFLNKSQEHLPPAKATVDGQKVMRPTKQYSAVASRYAAPVLPKKQLSTIVDGQANVTKLPFSTGRPVPHHERKPSSENLKSLQPPMVFAASARDPRPDTLTKKAGAPYNSLGAKRPRVTKRASMIEKKSQVETRPPRFYSLDKEGCSCSKNTVPGGPGNASLPGSVSLLHSAAHWLSLIQLAEGEKKHKVVIDLFRLAITLKTEPFDDVVVRLKRYQESYPVDQVVIQLVQQCEEIQQDTEAIEKAVCKPEDSNNSVPAIATEVSDSLSKITIVPPVVSGNLSSIEKNVPEKPPTAMVRKFSRSSTFSCVDTKSQAAKAVYGKTLAKTVEDLSMLATVSPTRVLPSKLSNRLSPVLPSQTRVVAQHSPSKAQNPPEGCVTEAETICKSPTDLEIHGQGDLQPSEKHPIPFFRTSLPVSDDQATPSLKAASNIVEMTPKAGSTSATGPPSANYSTPVSEAGSTPESALANGSAEKPVDSLSEWLDGESSEMGTPDIQSALTDDTVDLSPNGRGAVKLMDVDTLMKEVVSHILPDANENSPVEPNAAELSDRPSTLEFNVRRKSWLDAGEQSATDVEEKVTRSHRHSLSAEAVLLSIRGSVEEKVKLFTELAEVGGATSGLTELPASDSASKERHEAEVVEEPKEAAKEDKDNTQIVKMLETPVETNSTTVQNEATKATPLRVYTRQRSIKADVTPSVATPSVATPGDLASVGILRARHRRASSVGNMTPRAPFDLTTEYSPSGDSTSSPSVQSSSSAKSKRMSRGHREVTPRIHLPKPSWKAIVEREMKGSKLKDLLAAELPEETSPLAEYLEAQMENQNRDPEIGSISAKEKDVNSTCSPSKPLRKTTKSASKKQAAVLTPAPIKERNEKDAEPSTAQKHKKLNEGEQELDTNTGGCSTPGSAVRRSARIQSKVQSRRNMLFKEDFVYMK